MPLVRYQIGNEFRLGDPKLSLEADAEDPKAVLDGVAVSGLIGILRQLGDLAELAAEIFHDLEDEVTAVVSRSHKVATRVRRIEAALPSIEKAVRAQTSHIHFAYISGARWHTDIPNGQNNLSQSDWPQFLMDSYEHCRDPPRLFLLDKFDTGGAGACLKRYSDPSVFKMAGANLELVKADKAQWEKKPYKSKRKGRRQKNGSVRRTFSLSGYHSRMQLGYLNTGSQSVVAESNTTSDMQSALHFSSRSKSLDSKPRSDCTERVPDVNSCTGSEELQCNGLPSSSNRRMQDPESHASVHFDDQRVESSENHLEGQISSRPSSISCDEKTEIVKSRTQPCMYIPEDKGQDTAPLPVVFDQSKLEQDVATIANADEEDILFDFENIEVPFSSTKQFDKTEKVKLANQPCMAIPEDQLLDLDPLPVIIDQKLEQDAGSLRNVEQEILFHVNNVPASFSSKSQFEEIDMVKPTSQLCRTIPEDRGQELVSVPVTFDQSKLEQSSASLANADGEDILFDFEKKSASLSCDSKFNGVETLKSTHQLCPNTIEEQCQVLDPLPTTFNQSKLEQDAASPVNTVQDISIQNENMPASLSDKNEVDKAEILRLTSQSSIKAAEDCFQDIEPLPVTFNQPEWEKDSLNFVNVNQENTLLNIKNIPALFASKIQLGEISSEADIITGALNSTESEAEMQFECQAKKGVELCKHVAEDCSQDLEPLPATVNQPKWEKDSGCSVNEHQENSLFHVKDIPASCPSENRFDGIKIETDSFMDALNSNKSEVETDSECKAKQEVELCKNVDEECYQDLEPLPATINQPKWEKDSGCSVNEHQENSLFHVKDIPASCRSENRFDGIKIETDSFMDALNSKKSEVETDSECKAKQEVELCKNVDEERYQDLEPLPATINQPKWEKESGCFVNEHQENSLFYVKDIAASCPSESKFDGIRIETDSSMDALNSKKSEVETDSECKAKQEVELCKNIVEECNQDLDPLPATINQPKWEKDSGCSANEHQENSLFHVKDIPASCTIENRFDGVKIETDSFIDAFNSKISEVETDLACKAKQELELCKNVDEDCFHDLQPLPVICEQHKWEKNSVSFAIADQENALFLLKNIPASWPSKVLLDDISHETDNVMNVLKSKDSEVETDLECRWEQEVELPTMFKHQELENVVLEVHEVVAQNFESPNIDHPVPSFSPNKVSPKPFGSVFSENSSHAQSPKVTNVASNLVCASGAALDGSHDVIELPQANVPESLSGSPSSSSSNSDQVNKLTGSKTESQESCLPPIKFWTNGGLLGLEPSKPPVFNVSDVSNQNYYPDNKSVTDVLLRSSASSKMQHDLSAGKSDASDKPVKPSKQNSSSLIEKYELPDIDKCSDLAGICPARSVSEAVDIVQPVSLPEYSNLGCDKQDNSISMKPMSQEFVHAASEIRPEKVRDSHPTNGCSVATMKDQLHIISRNDFRSNENVQNSTAISTGMVGIGCRLLVNSFWRKPLPVRENSNDPSSVVGSDAMKLQKSTNHDELQKRQNGAVSGTTFHKEAKLGLEYPLSANSYHSGCPSPPLDHMKISFHATDGLETSKLTLQFRDLHDFQGSVDDAFFPLFQLLPEAACNLQDMGSESDDGTFYRSPPYLSEDLLSACSEPNSEEWESNEAAEGQDYEMYDALRRSSSTASISGPYNTEAITHCNVNPSCGFGCLNAEDSIKSFDHLNTPLLDYFMNRQDGKHGIDPLAQSLPELEWSITRPTFSLSEDREDTVCETINDTDSLQIQKFISQHPKTFATPHIGEATLSANGNMHDPEMQHRSTELNESANINKLDGRCQLLTSYQNRDDEMGGKDTKWSDG